METQAGIHCTTYWSLPYAPYCVGGETCTDMALFGALQTGVLGNLPAAQEWNSQPRHPRFRGGRLFSRVFRLLDPEAFQKWFLGFMRQFAQGCEGVLAIDGKTLRRSYDRAEAKSPLHLVNAWAAEQRLVLGQLAVDGKSNEITAVPKTPGNAGPAGNGGHR